MSHKVRESESFTEIKSAKYFCLVVDSTSDNSHMDQLAEIIISFVCFLPNVGRKAKRLFDVVATVFNKYGIDIKTAEGSQAVIPAACLRRYSEMKLEYEKQY